MPSPPPPALYLLRRRRAVATGGSAVVSVYRWLGSLPGADHDELAHQPPVLVAQQMAVEHVGRGRVGVVAEPGQETGGLARRDRDGVLPAGQARGRRPTPVLHELDLEIVHVEVVERPRTVADLPELGGVDGDHLVDAAE